VIRVGIIGCGKVADQHAVQIQRIPGAELTAVCDSEPLMAEQLCDRFGAMRSFTSADDMLDALTFDVVHITTPPQSHFALARRCLMAGTNVYIEKPFTLNTVDAEELIDLADRKGLKLTAGHNAQFSPAMVRMRELVKNGYLGGKPVHIESTYCYDLKDQRYAAALLGDREHWVRQLPGSLLQNIISHGVSKIAEFFTGNDPLVVAHGFTSAFLVSIGQGDIVDELRVLLRDEDSTTAYFTFSSQFGPTVHRLHLYGPKQSLIVDDDHQVVLKEINREYRSYLRYFLPPLAYAKQHVENLALNVRTFVTRDFHLPFDAGLHTLIAAFYHSIVTGAPPPIPYREILLTSRIMDDIFAQLKPHSTATGS